MKSHVIRALLALTGSALLLAPGTVDARDPIDTTATYYHPSLHGSVMANGERYDRSNPYIAACNWYPLGTLLKVTRPDTQDYIYVRVQDRGAHALTLDLSEAAFSVLGAPREGRIPVRLEIVQATDGAHNGLAEALRERRSIAVENQAEPRARGLGDFGLTETVAPSHLQLDEALLRQSPWLAQDAPAPTQ